MRAALACPRVTFLQRDLVEVAVAQPDLERALDVDLDDLGTFESVLREEQLFEDRIVERLRAQQTDVELDRLTDLAHLATPHDRRHRRLTAHADERNAVEASLDR